MSSVRTWRKDLSEDDQLLTRKVKLLDGVSEDNLGETVRVSLSHTVSIQ